MRRFKVLCLDTAELDEPTKAERELDRTMRGLPTPNNERVQSTRPRRTAYMDARVGA